MLVCIWMWERNEFINRFRMLVPIRVHVFCAFHYIWFDTLINSTARIFRNFEFLIFARLTKLFSFHLSKNRLFAWRATNRQQARHILSTQSYWHSRANKHISMGEYNAVDLCFARHDEMVVRGRRTWLVAATVCQWYVTINWVWRRRFRDLWWPNLFNVKCCLTNLAKKKISSHVKLSKNHQCCTLLMNGQLLYFNWCD